MSTYIHNFDSEEHNAYFEVLILYGYNPPECQRGACDYPDVYVDGSVELWEVTVLHFDRYNDNGEIIEAWERGDEPDARSRELDQLAYNKVLDELDEGWLAERLSREAA
jgi:hypothetical protein